MSKENVELFYEALARDKNLQTKFTAINQQYQGQKLTESQKDLIMQKELVPLAREAGFDFTPAEYKSYAAETRKPAMQEISEEELASVAGGSCVCVVGGTGCSCTTSGAGAVSPSIF